MRMYRGRADVFAAFPLFLTYVLEQAVLKHEAQVAHDLSS